MKCRKYRKPVPKNAWDYINAGIYNLQLSFADVAFKHETSLLKLKWSTNPFTHQFIGYLFDQWTSTLPLW